MPLLDTLIRKLLQFLLNLLVNYFRDIYIYAREFDQEWCQLRGYVYCRNFVNIGFLSIIAGCEKICSEDHWITSYIRFIYMIGYLSILPIGPALNQGIFSKFELATSSGESVMLICKTATRDGTDAPAYWSDLRFHTSCDWWDWYVTASHTVSRSRNLQLLTPQLDLLRYIFPHHFRTQKNM
jgi:hypothetical protein